MKWLSLQAIVVIVAVVFAGGQCMARCAGLPCHEPAPQAKTPPCHQHQPAKKSVPMQTCKLPALVSEGRVIAANVHPSPLTSSFALVARQEARPDPPSSARSPQLAISPPDPVLLRLSILRI